MIIPDIPKIAGVNKMSPLEMNGVHFDKKHTVLTPQLLDTLVKPAETTSL